MHLIKANRLMKQIWKWGFNTVQIIASLEYILSHGVSEFCLVRRCLVLDNNSSEEYTIVPIVTHTDVYGGHHK